MKEYNIKLTILIIGTIIILSLVIFGSIFSGLKIYKEKKGLESIEQQLGSVEIGDYIIKTTGTDQVISYGPAILHSIVFGTANDAVLIGDVLSTTSISTNPVFNITATVPQAFNVETIFKYGILANVTSSDGVVFIISPR